MSHGMASRGAVDLVDYFIRKSTRDMSSQMKQLDLESMKVTAKIRKACEIRLKMTQPFIRKWPEAVALLLLPQNLPTTLSNLHELVDEMWYLAGDRSVDMNYYSKRGLLTGVYTSTEMYMTQDRSEEFKDTFKFLDRRLEDVGKIGRTTSQAFQLASFTSNNAVGVLKSYGIKLPFS